MVMNLNNEKCHFHTPKKCRILTCMICEDEKCSFYKTTKEYNDGLEKYPPIDYPLYKITGKKVYLERTDKNE